MAQTTLVGNRRYLRILTALAVALLLVACGGAPAPVPTAPGAGYTPLASAALPTATVAPATAVSPTPSPQPATVTAAASASPAAASATGAGAPTATAAAASGTATAAAGVAAEAQTPAPVAAWVVRDLKVGPGRTYAFLVSTAPQDGAADAYQLLFSDDDGKTWAPFAGGLPVADCYNSVSLDYASLDSLYVGLCQGGLYHWTGSEWALLSQQSVGALEVVYLKPQIMWSANPQPATGGPRVSRSEDGGKTWVAADAGVGQEGVAYLGIDPRDSNTLYAAVPSLYRGTADGRWVDVIAGQPFLVTVNGIAIEGGNGAVYVSLGASNQVWRSRNANATDVATITWDLVHDFGPDRAVRLLATGPSGSGLALYANLAPVQPSSDGGTGYGDYLPYRSPDGGTTWERIVIPGWID